MSDQEPDQEPVQNPDQEPVQNSDEAPEQKAETAPDQKPEIIYDRNSQLEQVQSGLLPDEQIVAVYDAIGTGTGFIGLTNRRVVIQDKSFVGQRVALTSIPYSKITSVSVVSNKSWAGSFFSSGSIAIHVGPHTYEIDFRGTHKSHHVHNLILYYIGH